MQGWQHSVCADENEFRVSKAPVVKDTLTLVLFNCSPPQMSDRPQARHAYYQVCGDLDRCLLVRNSDKNRQRQYSPWDEVRHTINDDASTFTLHVSRLDMVPLNIPATGDGYQILHSLDGWHRPSTSSVVHDPVTESYVSAPSRFEGDLVISFKWTIGNWLRAWAYWVWRTALRIVAWVLLLVVLIAIGWALWQTPWSRLAQPVLARITGLAAASATATARHESATTTASPTPSPPSGEMIAGRGPRVGNH